MGRADLLNDAVRAINAPHGLIAVYGKRGVGKSSLVRQLQQIALGDYTLIRKAGLSHCIPRRPRTYLTVYYQCDSTIEDTTALLSRLCNDQNDEDGLLRLVPNDGKEIVEFNRSKTISGGADLKVINWGVSGVESSKYARVVPGDVVQTFRNFISAVVAHQVRARTKRDGILILLDEIDVIKNKAGLGSLIKSISSDSVKFCVCGIAKEISALIADHESVQRLLEEGSLLVKPMPAAESEGIIVRAEELFGNNVVFNGDVKVKIGELSCGYPYFVQIIGKACIGKANEQGTKTVSDVVFQSVLDEIRSGQAFPTLESKYQRAIGTSEQREILLHLLAEQPEEETGITEESGRVYLRNTRKTADEFGITNVSQVIPRLIDKAYGPALVKVDDREGVYEFPDPVFRLYIRLRALSKS